MNKIELGVIMNKMELLEMIQEIEDYLTMAFIINKANGDSSILLHFDNTNILKNFEIH